MTGVSTQSDATEVDAPLDYDEFLHALRLVGVDLVKASVTRLRPGSSPETSFEVSFGASVDGERVLVQYLAKASMLSRAEDGAQPGAAAGEVECAVVATFLSSKVSTISDANVRYLAETSVGLMTHPYLRQSIQDLASRIGFYGVVLPMVTFPPGTPRWTQQEREVQTDGQSPPGVDV